MCYATRGDGDGKLDLDEWTGGMSELFGSASDADFEKYMKSPRSEFNAMKGWKQQQLKKAAGLY